MGRISIGVLARHWSAKAAGLKSWRPLEPEIEHFVMAITSAEATVRQLAPAKMSEQGNGYG
jgi:hypothetical protein